jgi:hypothetical protein
MFRPLMFLPALSLLSLDLVYGCKHLPEDAIAPDPDLPDPSDPTTGRSQKQNPSQMLLEWWVRLNGFIDWLQGSRIFCNYE